MMAKSRLLGGYCGNAVETTSESEGSGTSGRMDADTTVLEDFSMPARKCNSIRRDGFDVPMQVIPLSNLSAFKRKDLVQQLRSELKQVRLLQKKVELQRTNGVTLSPSSVIISCSNGQNKGPRKENPREPSISNSVPGNELKPSGQSQKPQGWNRSSSGKFDSSVRTTSPSSANALLIKDCEALLKRLMTHQYAWVFNTPVDVVKLKLPDYFSVIKHPMDLGTVKTRLAAGAYRDPLDFAGDVRLTFSNAMTYNPRENDVHGMADTLSKYFEVRWKAIEKKLPRKDAQRFPTKPATSEDVETTRPVPLLKKRKTVSLPHEPEVMPPAKQVMSYQEKPTLEDVETTRPVPPSKKRKTVSLPPEPEVMPPAKQVMPYQEKPATLENVETTRPVPASKKREMVSLPPEPAVMPPAKQLMSYQEKPATLKDVENTRPVPPSKKRETVSVLPEPEVMPPAKQVMSYQEKLSLGRQLESLLAEMPGHIIDFLKDHSSNGGECEEDEIEIDIDDLSDDTLFRLRELLDDFLQEKQKKKAKVEAYEIELVNDSGPSNSSLQEFKGNDDPADEEDIGRNVPTVSKYPAVEMEKDKTYKPNKHSSLGSSESISDLDKHKDDSQQNPSSFNSDCYQNGECAPTERQVSPDKLYRAALLKNRFADTILKAREKTLAHVEKGDPEKLRQERERLEMEQRIEKARLQAEAKAAEDARKRTEAKVAAEVRRQRELEREAARQALLQVEKTVEINENSQFFKDLEMLGAVPGEQLPSSADETSPDHSQDAIGCFAFGGSNPLEQLGLYMKADDDEDEGDLQCVPNPVDDDDVEEGEIDVEEGEIN